jgi:hypothetical protein
MTRRRRRRSRGQRFAETVLTLRAAVWFGRRLWRPALSLVAHRLAPRFRLR